MGQSMNSPQHSALPNHPHRSTARSLQKYSKQTLPVDRSISLSPTQMSHNSLSQSSLARSTPQKT